MPIELEPMLDLLVVSFGFWFHPFFFLPQFVFSADGRPFGLINVLFSELSASDVKDLIVFVFHHLSFVDFVSAHIHLRAFYLLFLDNFKGFDSNKFNFTGFF